MLCFVYTTQQLNMKVLVYGATGSQQFSVLAALQQKGAQVYATTSSETGVATLTQAGVTLPNGICATTRACFRLFG